MYFTADVTEKGLSRTPDTSHRRGRLLRSGVICNPPELESVISLNVCKILSRAGAKRAPGDAPRSACQALGLYIAKLRHLAKPHQRAGY